jgi:hypothetical protein
MVTCPLWTHFEITAAHRVRPQLVERVLHPGCDVPVTYQAEPWSASRSPWVWNAVSRVRAAPEYPETSKLALSRTRRPYGGLEASVFDPQWLAGAI